MEKIRVVIAEDEAIIRLDLRETLENAGYEVVADTGRGDEAVKLVSEHKPEVVILDIKMPGMDGIQVAREIAATEDTAVVILTAFSQRELIDEAVDAFTTSFVELPTDTGIYFTRGDKISFQPQWDGGEPVEFEGNLIEITENLASFLNEGMDWKIWILKKDKLWWSFVEKPYLVN